MNNNITHVLRARRKLYRTGTSNQGLNKNTTFTYFTYGKRGKSISEQEYSRYQGSKVRTYKTTKPLKLLKLNTVAGVNYLRNKIAKDVTNTLNEQKKKKKKKDLKALKKSFPIQAKEGKKMVTRNSVIKYNNRVAGAMCRLGYDGYITKQMHGQNYSKFHPEIVLCKPAGKLKGAGSRPSTVPPKVGLHARAPSKRSPGTPKTSPIRRLGTPKTSPRTPRTPNASPRTPKTSRKLGF